MYYYSKLRWLLSFAVLFVFTNANAQENDLLEELDSLSKEEVIFENPAFKALQVGLGGLIESHQHRCRSQRRSPVLIRNVGQRCHTQP